MIGLNEQVTSKIPSYPQGDSLIYLLTSDWHNWWGRIEFKG